ncbi:glycosyltransferase family 4 protein [Sulfurifustis variabilis]|uniref:glycosyltransferase family 4 protein n=1 Tax=Sulfurifustis variabilis TaxID=1675686 RepID=UPI000BBAB84D|nr:glycosyltransferase family 4 protein [Sulfurifustis variabilis]
MTIRLLALSNIMAPYRVALFNEVASQSEVDLHVAYIAESESNRSWRIDESAPRYPFTVLSGLHLRIGEEKTLHFSWGVPSLLNKFRPHVVFLGADLIGSNASWVLWYQCRKRGIPIIRYEARHWHAADAHGWRDVLFGFLIKRMDRYFVYSCLTKDYLMQKYGVPSTKIDIGYNVGDSKYFVERVQKLRADADFDAERSTYPSVLILFVGALNDRKNVTGLLDACGLIGPELRQTIGLLVVGDGPLREQLETKASTLEKVKVYFTGFLEGDDLARCFALADVFVLPSLSDAASIALGEALHCGLFAIASKRDGSAANFIQAGHNGWTVDPNEVRDIARAIRLSISAVQKEPGPNRRQRLAKTMADYTLEHYSQRLVGSVRRVMGIPGNDTASADQAVGQVDADNHRT